VEKENMIDLKKCKIKLQQFEPIPLMGTSLEKGR
jgi:hypothetical protein